MIPDIPLTILLLFGMGLIIFILIIWLVRLEMRINKLTRGANGHSLEDAIATVITNVESLQKQSADARRDRKRLDTDLQSTIRGVHTVRFDPYTDGTGKQSFATAMVNAEGTGVVLSSLYTREQCRMFAKPITKGVSEYELSTEEQSAIEHSMASIQR